MKDATIVVTGAAKGIGRAVALRCLKEGSHVIACDKDALALKSLEDGCGRPDLISTMILDVTVPEEVAAFFDDIGKGSRPLYGLVNNVGIFLGRKFLDYTFEEMAHVLRVNLMSAMYCSQAFGRSMIPAERRGAIVNIASVAAQSGSADAVYGTSKAAMVGLTKTCAMSFAPFVRVNAVAPGLVDTDMLETIADWRVEQFRQAELIKESIKADDVAQSVHFLLSAASAHITGTVLDINNGYYLR